MLKALNYALLIGSTLLCLDVAAAGETASDPGEKMPKMRREMRGKRNFMQRSEFITAKLVRKELKAYMADKSPENFAALEKALTAAMQADTAKRKAKLEKELANLDKVQSERASKFLNAVKSGEFRMPPRPQRNKRGDRRPGPPVTE